MKVAVAGGTGLVGKHVVAELRAGGDEVVVLARSTGVDLLAGTGVDAALAGCDAVIDVTNISTLSRRTAVAFFDATAHALLSASRQGGVGHLVALSIVGVDDVDLGYYQGKRRQEEVIRAGGVPWTLLRATQFHEFAGQLTERAHGPIVAVPAMLSRPVAAAEVAARLVDLVRAGPRGDAEPIAGPEVLRLVDMVRGHLLATCRRRVVVPMRLPGATGRAAASGALLPREPFVRGTTTFSAYLTELRRTTPR